MAAATRPCRHLMKPQFSAIVTPQSQVVLEIWTTLLKGLNKHYWVLTDACSEWSLQIQDEK